ncbi:MAG: NADH-quinone oxidoreductase subunit D [Planctomycetota bacterium]|nr:NADH-quinone oxidoreductase subunit D [Planctomycetota bacterium]
MSEGSDKLILNVGPQHPSTHGVLHFRMHLDGEVIERVDPEVGYLHRSIEKISESRWYEQIPIFCDRVDYTTAMTAVLGFCLAVETLYNKNEIKVPERAWYLRVVVTELQRIASHFLWLATFGLELGAFTVYMYAFREREKVLDLFEEIAGERITINYPEIGGFGRDMPEGWAEKALKFCRELDHHLDEIEDLLTNNPIFLARTKGIGAISGPQAIDYGLTGPNARASGIDFDLRREEPWGPYPELDFKVPVREEGDVYARYLVRIEEIRQAGKITTQALDKMPGGRIKADLPRKRWNIPTDFLQQFGIKSRIRTGIPRRLRPEPNETYFRMEGPRGEYGVFIVSRGSV